MGRQPRLRSLPPVPTATSGTPRGSTSVTAGTTRGTSPPRFPFGHGLSYTTFAIAGVKATPDGATFDVTNTGKVAGATVAQVYVRPLAGTFNRPVQELKGFQRADLKPGETRHVSVPLDHRSFAYWNVATHGWKVDPGPYEIAVGQSSRDIGGTAKIDVK